MEITDAKKKMETYLAQEEAKINDLGSALPGYVNPNVRLEILNESTEEYEFGWVIYYNSAEFVAIDHF